MKVEVWVGAAVLASVLGFASAASDDSMSALRERAAVLLAGGAGEVDGPRYHKATAGLDRSASAALADAGDALAFKGAEDASKSVRLSRHFRRVSLLARAYSAVGGRYCGDAAVLAKIEAELRRGLPFIAPGCPRPGNWHGYLIQMPYSLATILLLTGDRLDADLRRQVEVCAEGLMETMTLTGANATTEAINNILYGLHRGDADRVARAVAHMLPAITCGTAGGILEDYAYQFHGRMLYAAGYGAHFLRSTSLAAYLVDDTPWALPPERLRLLTRLTLEHMQWVASGTYWDISVTGRGNQYNGGTAGVCSSLVLLSQLDSPDRPALAAAAARMAAQHEELPMMVAALADQAAAAPAEPLRGFRYYPTSDLAVQQGDGFYASVKMFSRRVQDYEVLTQKGMNGWNLSNGLTHISRGRGEWWTGAAPKPMSYLDWDHLPGTTCRVGANPPDEPESIHDSVESLNFGRSAFSGAAGDEAGGLAAFVLIPHRGEFEARKAYFFFDEGFAAVGAAVAGAAFDGKPVHTTVTQWASPTADAPLLLSGGREVAGWAGVQAFPDVRWAWLDGVGYVFDEPVTLFGRRDRRLTTLWLDHGPAPRDGRYAYVVLPAATVERTEAEAAEGRIRIQSNTADLQAITDTRDGSWGAVFYRGGVCGAAAVDKPAVVHWRPRSGGAVLSVQNPMHTDEELTLTLTSSMAVAAAPEEVRVDAAGPATRLTVDTALGRVYRVGLGAAADVPQPRREDMRAYHNMLADAESDAEATYLSVRVPADARRRGYRLIVRGYKGHNLVELTDEDIAGSDEQTVRYRWGRRLDPSRPTDTLFNQRAGSFRLALISGGKVGVDYFTVPAFPIDGHEPPAAWLEPDKTRPPGR